jgi:hypothetical protein
MVGAGGTRLSYKMARRPSADNLTDVPPSRIQRASALLGNETVSTNFTARQRSTAIYIVTYSLTECPKHRHPIFTHTLNLLVNCLVHKFKKMEAQ